MDMVQASLEVLGAIIKIIIGVILAVVAVNIGLILFEKITQMGRMGELNILKELEDGNAAVAILMIGVVLAIAIVIRSGILSLTDIPVYDFRTKGCYDGLIQGGVNLNQGAESTLSFLLSLLAIVESYAVVDKLAEGAEVTEEKVVLIKATPIRDITGKDKLQHDKVEELA